MSSTKESRGRRRGVVVRLRRWLLGAAVFLLLVLAGLIGYARHRINKAKLDLPRLLGADIRSQTDGFTYSQSVKGRTLFTIHAARAIQRQNGKVTLHDVQVTLYGEPGSNRVDSIRGSEFEYDQPNGVVRAVGETQLDLASPVTNSQKVAGESKRVSVRATGLVFLEKLGVAATEGPIHFDYSTMSGDARGADYDADTGVLQLRHDVHLFSRENGHVEKVDADSARLDRNDRTIVMDKALLRDASDTLRAALLHVQLRPEGAKEAGSIQSMRGEGGVEFVHGADVRVTAPGMFADWAQGERPRTVRMVGGVHMLSAGQGEGQAAEALLALNGAGQPERVTLMRSVSLATTGDKDGPARTLTADQVVANFTAAKKPTLQDLVATGHSRLVTFDASQRAGKPSSRTTLTANVLRAFGKTDRTQWLLQRVEGDGATRIEQASEDGLVRVSSGNELVATFDSSQRVSPTSVARTKPATSSPALQSLVQQGSVVVEENRPPTPAGPAGPARPAGASRATANRAEYQASTGRTELTGAPQVTTTGLQVAADAIQIEQGTGNAQAQGRVRGTYLSADTTQAKAKQSTAEPLHFLAARAEFNQGEQRVLLSGEAGARARLWSSTGQIEANVIDLNEKTGTLRAHGAAKESEPYAVSTVLPAAGPADAAVRGNKSPASRKPSLVRIVSRTLIYVQGTKTSAGQAQFQGGVRLDQGDAQISADSATAELLSSARGDRQMLGDSVKSVEAQGRVRIQRPGRTAAGSRLQYTTADQRFVLTGTPAAPPSVQDSVRGLVTGSELIFHAGDDSVEVAGETGQPVHTDVVVPPRNGPARSAAQKRGDKGKAATSNQ